MFRTVIQFLVIGVILATGIVSASPDTHDVWTGTEHQILMQALRGLTPAASAKAQKQLSLQENPLSLEKKLWIIIDSVMADEGHDYQRWFILSAFATVGDKDIATDYSAKKARLLIRDLNEKLDQYINEKKTASEEEFVIIKNEFTGEAIKTTKTAVRLQQRSRFAAIVLEGAFGILYKAGTVEDAKLAGSLKSSSIREIQSIGTAFEDAILKHFKTPNRSQ